MAVALQDRKRVSTSLKSWTDDVAGYEREFKSWEGRVKKITDRYRDDKRTNNTGLQECKFNILWSNVQTLVAATFSRLPKPDVSRRFRDNDPTGRVASLVLERNLDYHVQHYPEYRSTLLDCVRDRFIGGRGTAWVRYEPHFKQREDDVQVTDDVEDVQEELDYECVSVDYVHYKDYGHSVARTWEEVNRVWRKVYMTKEALQERFGKEKAAIIPMDASPKEAQGNGTDYKPSDAIDRACIYEGWDKSRKEAVWFSKGVKDFLDRRPDPLGLEGFFPCPRPIFATLTNESLVPIPDFTLYQDQANELDQLADKIDGLVKALKVCGGYDGSVPELQRIFTEGVNGTLIPIKNWQAFAEKNGLQGALSLVDLAPIAAALKEAYIAFQQVKEQVYELTGISDIVRGQTEASETATAQQIKGQYASLRLKTYQEEVARFATDILQLMGQVICLKFSPQTIAAQAAADQLSEQDKQLLPQAIALLVGPERVQDPAGRAGPNPLRSFRIDIAADSLVQLDERVEKESRMEFLGAVGTFFKNVSEVLMMTPPQAQPTMVGLSMELLKFGVTGFKVGKQIEGALDEAAEKLKQIAANPPPPQPDPGAAAEQAKAQAATQKAHLDVEVAERKAQIDERKMQMEEQHDIREMQIKDAQQQQQAVHSQQDMARKREQAELQHRQRMQQAMIPRRPQ